LLRLADAALGGAFDQEVQLSLPGGRRLRRGGGTI
jgi:hypothetical protein